MKTICVYCGSSDRIPSAYLEAARQFGTMLAEKGMTLAYGAGSTGIMGVLADAVLERGGVVVGVIPALFNMPQLVHKALTRLEVVADMHTRKSRLAELADAFVALPGGYGTLDEFFEILTWAQIGLHQKPIGLLNTQGYFDALLSWVEHARVEGFIYEEHRSLFTHAETPGGLLEALAGHRAPAGLERWLTREE